MFTWFKELFTLAKMLFKRTDEKNEVDIITMKYFPFKGYIYMAWCGEIITRKNITWDDMSESSKNEEFGHLKQASFYKYWFQYYLVYVWEWIKGNPIIAPASSAYFTIPFEMHAKANRHNSSYDYNRDDLKNKYTLRNRKQLYKMYRFEWENYCRGL